MNDLLNFISLIFYNIVQLYILIFSIFLCSFLSIRFFLTIRCLFLGSELINDLTIFLFRLLKSWLFQNRSDIFRWISFSALLLFLIHHLFFLQMIVDILGCHDNLRTLREVAMLIVISYTDWNKTLIKSSSDWFIISVLFLKNLARRWNELAHFFFDTQWLPIHHPVIISVIIILYQKILLNKIYITYHFILRRIFFLQNLWLKRFFTTLCFILLKFVFFLRLIPLK